jgi:hypothetical protein
LLIQTVSSAPRAVAKIQHHQAYDFDEKSKLWRYRLMSEDEAKNIITDAGRVRVHTYLYGSAGQRAGLGGGLNYVALSNDGTAPAAGDTVLAGEITNSVATAGLQRALGTVTLPTGSGTVTTIQKVFVFTGTPGPQNVQKTALFDSSSGGTMAHEIAFSPRVLYTNDSLTVTMSITLA